LHNDLQSLQPLEPTGHLDRHLLCADRFHGHVWIGGHRFHLRQNSPLRGGRKRGAFNNAIGRSRGGQTTKIHALTDDLGRPLAVMITPGNTHDLVGARGLIGMAGQPRRLLADRAYDAKSLRDELARLRIKAVIPPNPTRKHPHRYDKDAYKGRNVIERMFCRLKDFRRIATRYDKRADIFLSTILLAAALTWWIN
jgi:transposase